MLGSSSSSAPLPGCGLSVSDVSGSSWFWFSKGSFNGSAKGSPISSSSSSWWGRLTWCSPSSESSESIATRRFPEEPPTSLDSCSWRWWSCSYAGLDGRNELSGSAWKKWLEKIKCIMKKVKKKYELVLRAKWPLFYMHNTLHGSTHLLSTRLESDFKLEFRKISHCHNSKNGSRILLCPRDFNVAFKNVSPTKVQKIRTTQIPPFEIPRYPTFKPYKTLAVPPKTLLSQQKPDTDTPAHSQNSGQSI